MYTRNDRKESRVKAGRRIRERVRGGADKPRLAVHRSLKHIYAQAIDDEAGRTVAAASTQDRELRASGAYGGNVEAAKRVGEAIGGRLKQQGIEQVVFDRGVFAYHGRIKALADAARAAGLKFCPSFTKRDISEGSKASPLIKGDGRGILHCPIRHGGGGNMHQQNEDREVLEKALNLLGLNQSVTRRSFFKLSGITVVGISALVSLGAKSGKEMPLIIMDQAEGLVIPDSTRCVGCRRCELACTEFNDGKAAPTMSRIKVSRNLQFGPQGLYTEPLAQGSWGNGLVIQDFCKQCPHPVPCANACPNDAIVIHIVRRI